MMNALQLVISNGLCSGCGLCQALFGKKYVEIKFDAQGFLRPFIHNNPSTKATDILFEVCPGLNVNHILNFSNYDIIWGPICNVYIAAASDKVVRHTSSSGGVLSAIQNFLLESKEVDFIVATSASNNDPLGSEVNICRTREDVIRGSGSRYSPSAPLIRIMELLEVPGRFAFVGKPCDVAALRRLSKHDKRITDKIPYMLSFMCAGVPSIHGTYSIIEKLGVSIDEVTSFRYRGNGWPGFTIATLKDGTSRRMTYAESWGDILSKYIQWRCKLCPDGTGEFADITCGDAWHVKENGTADFSEHDGQSFLIIRNKKGKELLRRCQEVNTLAIFKEINKKYIENVQLHQVYRRQTMLVRYLATKLIGCTYPKFNLRVLITASKSKSPWTLFRVFSGALIRAIRTKRKL